MSDLTDLGLSSYEEAAYRALLSLGRATAGAVADASDVPEGRIYDVLNGLAARDLVAVHASAEPRRYEAVDPDAAVDRLLAERKRELDAERERYEELAASLRGEFAETIPAQGRFWPIGLGSDDAVAAMREQFDRAEDLLLSVIGPPYVGAAPEAYSAETDAYLDLVREAVDVKLLTTPSLLDSKPGAKLRDALADAHGFAVRARAGIGLSYDVLDGEAVYVSVPAPFAAGERVGGVVVRDEAFARSMAERFHRAWAEADPVSP